MKPLFDHFGYRVLLPASITVASSMAMATGGVCVNPDLSKLSQGVSMTMCDGSTGVGTYVAPDLTNLSAGNVAFGVTIGGVTGTYAISPCSSDNQTACTTTAQYPSIAASSLSDPFDFRATADGFGKMKYCRSGYNLSAYDHPESPVNMSHIGKTFTAASATDLITIQARTFIQALASVPIRLTSSTALPSPLVSGNTYYSIWVSTTTIKLAASLTDANAGIAIDLTDAGTGTHRMFPVGDGMAQYWDVADDFNSPTGTQGNWFSSNYFGSEYLCTISDWRLIAPSGNGTTVTAGAATDCDDVSDDCMVQDLMTKQIWTELNPKGAGVTLTWAESLKFCNDLVFGGFSDWRLPQIKEFMQAYIDGIYSTEYTYPSFGASGDLWMWSATPQGGGPWDSNSNFVYAFWGSGEFQASDATTSAGRATRCVRN